MPSQPLHPHTTRVHPCCSRLTCISPMSNKIHLVGSVGRTLGPSCWMMNTICIIFYIKILIFVHKIKLAGCFWPNALLAKKSMHWNPFSAKHTLFPRALFRLYRLVLGMPALISNFSHPLAVRSPKPESLFPSPRARHRRRPSPLS
jgi:lysylphosphatidylglycerol synthetase-like protein (DUF2156 family)